LFRRSYPRQLDRYVDPACLEEFADGLAEAVEGDATGTADTEVVVQDEQQRIDVVELEALD
jgi:hypothetical protein